MTQAPEYPAVTGAVGRMCGTEFKKVRSRRFALLELHERVWPSHPPAATSFAHRNCHETHRPAYTIAWPDRNALPGPPGCHGLTIAGRPGSGSTLGRRDALPDHGAFPDNDRSGGRVTRSLRQNPDHYQIRLTNSRRCHHLTSVCRQGRVPGQSG